MKQNIITFILTHVETHSTDIDNVFESICSTIMTKIQKYHTEGLDWTMQS